MLGTNDKTNRQGGLNEKLVQALKTFFRQNPDQLGQHFQFVENFNNEDLLQFALRNLQKISRDEKMEKGTAALKRAMDNRLLHNLKVLLKDQDIPMDPSFYD